MEKGLKGERNGGHAIGQVRNEKYVILCHGSGNVKV